MFPFGWWVIVVCSSMLACQREQSPPAQVSSSNEASSNNEMSSSIEVPRSNEETFVVATPAVARDSLSARFSAALPTSLGELRKGAYPPRGFIADALARDTHDMRRRYVDALSRAASAGSIHAELADWYQATPLLSDEKVAICRWLVEAAQRKLPGAARDVLWGAVMKCNEPEVASVLEDRNVPDHRVVQWFAAQWGAQPFSPRAVKAAVAVARRSTDEEVLRDIGHVFANMTGEEAPRALEALQASIDDPYRRALLGIEMCLSTSPRGRAIGALACKHPKLADDSLCDELRMDLEEAHLSLQEMLERHVDMSKVLATQPREEVIAALVEGARSHPSAAHSYYRRLVATDRPSAVALAPELRSSEDPELAAAARSLLRFSSVSDIEAELGRLGFTLGALAIGADTTRFVHVDEVLFARGRGLELDVETDKFPNEHDVLLYRLARIVTPALDGVVFEEIPPHWSGNDSRPYRLDAYLDGMRYSVAAENRGDWYDVGAAVGLINALLVARRSDMRLAILRSRGQNAVVVAGPAMGIRTLVDARLLELGEASEAERTGKESEERAARYLRRMGEAGLPP